MTDRRSPSRLSSSANQSLKAYALALLSRRDHSREELTRKLVLHARRLAAHRAEEGDGTNADDGTQAASLTDTLTALLDELERDNWLSNPRFAENFSRRRGAGRGTAQVLHELRTHKLDAAELETVREQLLATEPARARAVWEKKFGQPPADAKAWAKQARFMLSRGFSASTFKQVLAQVAEGPVFGPED